jgi:hypothetical protein
MGRLRNHRHELVAQALADGKSRAEAMTAAGYAWHHGNQNRLAQLPVSGGSRKPSTNTELSVCVASSVPVFTISRKDVMRTLMRASAMKRPFIAAVLLVPHPASMFTKKASQP